MSVTILHKQSVVSSNVPDVAQLQAGEFAINIADGAVFIKTTADEIVDLLTYTFADGGVITAPEIGILRLRTETGDRLVTATGEYINVDQNND